MPNSWEYVRLGEVIYLLSGRDLAPSQYNAVSNGIPYITGASNFSINNLIINRWTTEPVVISHYGDLLITCKGTIGTISYNMIGDVHIARQVMAINSKHIYLPYIKMFLLSYIDTLQSKAKSMIPGISRDDLCAAIIPIPPYSEQIKISKYISKIFDTIKGEN